MMEFYTGRLPAGFKYVGQDNYCIYDLEAEKQTPYSYLYSDSATSCIIVIAIGESMKNGHKTVCMAHLSRLQRFDAFFQLMTKTLKQGVYLYAQGANPVSDSTTQTSTQNVIILMQNLQSIINANSAYFATLSISVGQGNPNCGWGTYGVSVDAASADYLQPTNRYYELSNTDRCTAQGVQTLFCVYGLKTMNIHPEQLFILHNTDELEFPKNEIKTLVDRAIADDFTQICDMTDDEILTKYSSTPQYEAAWFCATMREAAEFANNYYK
ncbi:hypothetical protein [Propionispira raffinosivorans]|uniref:hypothetical protein n=1 Tax=Propionispira raffinosivorans TaxID=86959 RepID=UPI001469F524|nr:hypothetical protein [Propionispira raffinosivorans]